MEAGRKQAGVPQIHRGGESYLWNFLIPRGKKFRTWSQEEKKKKKKRIWLIAYNLTCKRQIVTLASMWMKYCASTSGVFFPSDFSAANPDTVKSQLSTLITLAKATA